MFFAGGAGIQLDVFSGNHHFNGFGAAADRQKAKTGKKAFRFSRADKTYFTGRVGLCLEKEQAKHKIPEPAAAQRWNDTDISQPERTVLPPDSSGRGRFFIHENQRVPALRIVRLPGNAENFFLY